MKNKINIISAFLIIGLTANPLVFNNKFSNLPELLLKDGTPDEVNGFNINENIEKPNLFLLVENDSLITLNFPVTPKTKIENNKSFVVMITGYSSTTDETDDSPFITALGTHVRDGVAASNFLPLGTAIKIPEIFGDKIFLIEDRMADRFWFNVDIWFPDKFSAKNFGSRIVRIEIVS